MSQSLIDEIENKLPQTQCGLCDYAGCRPYAEALVLQGESIDRCPPGGVVVLKALGELLNIDSAPYQESMLQKQKPSQIVVIQEEACIGCTKCIPVCPVDAIIGSAKQMHTVLSDVCTGCELCIAPCPMDCIDIVLVDRTQEAAEQLAHRSKNRYEAHQTRLQKPQESLPSAGSIQDRKAEIAAMLARKKPKSAL